MDSLFKQDNKWFVKGPTTTDLGHFISTVLHQDLCQGRYSVGSDGNSNKFTIFSMDDTGLTSHFVIYVYTHQNGRHTLVLYGIQDPPLADKFTLDIQKVLDVNVVQGEEDFHDFDLRVRVDKDLVTKIIEHVNKL
jgi:hypothetical protein